MKIAILSRNPNLYSTRRLVEAGVQRGHEVQVIDTLRAYMNIASHKPQIHYRGRALEGFDAVIPRIGASVTFYGCAVLRQFEMMGVFPLNESVAISRSRDKLRSLQLLSRKGIGLPVTGFAHSPDDVPDLIRMVGGAPLVIKVLEGTQGIGVVLCETEKAAESVIEAFMGLKQDIMVQEYIQEAGGADIRCFVVGDKVIAAMAGQTDTLVGLKENVILGHLIPAGTAYAPHQQLKIKYLVEQPIEEEPERPLMPISRIGIPESEPPVGV